VSTAAGLVFFITGDGGAPERGVRVTLPLLTCEQVSDADGRAGRA
jgi:hypothetical protein